MRAIPRQRTNLPPIWAKAPNTCSTRARGVAIGDRAVASFLFLGDAFGRVTAPLNMHPLACLLQADFAFNAWVSPIGIDASARLTQVEQVLEDSGVGYGSMRDGDLAD